MEQPPVLILSPRYSRDSKELGHAAIQAGWQVERLGDFVAPPEFKAFDVAIFGESVFARLVAKSLDMVLIQPPLHWLAELSYSLLKREVRYTTLGQARNISRPMFVKPAGEKSFIAQVYDSSDKLPPANIISDLTPVLVIEPVAWELEFRCFVLERMPVALSIYKRNGELARDEAGQWMATPEELTEAWQFCQSIVHNPQILIPPAVALDVGVIKDRGWAVIEANPVSASGIYGCDPAAILPVLKRASVKKELLQKSDLKWILAEGAHQL